MTTSPTVPSLPRQRSGPLLLLHRASLILLLALVLLLVGVRFSPAPWVFPTLPKLTHTATGAAGDPLNVILIGDATNIAASFAQAGWLVPDPITPQTSARIVAASLAHQPYPTAPVSHLYVFGRVQDLAFEWPTTDVQNRGHIRLWLTTLRLAGQPVWLGAASYDHGFELSGRTGFPTHHIAPAVDLERDTVGTDLARTGLVVAEEHAPFTPPVFVAYNGGGDYYASDGQVLLITLVHTARPLPAPTGLSAAVAALTRGLFRAYDAILTTPALAVVAVLVAVVLIVLALWPHLARLLRLLRSRGGRRAAAAPGHTVPNDTTTGR